MTAPTAMRLDSKKFVRTIDRYILSRGGALAVLLLAIRYLCQYLQEAHIVSDSFLFGLPLYEHVNGGCARGVVAVGAYAFGLMAFGGLAIGLTAVGGGAVGVVAIGGGAVGLVAIGGGACGLIALGGGAFGVIAIGGGAKGRYVFAKQGTGRYVFDLRQQNPVAAEFFRKYFPGLRQVFVESESETRQTA